MADDLKKMYRTIMDDHFPPRMEISFVDGPKRQTLVYDKVTWVIEAVEKGLRYGENPGQEAALYKLVNGNLVLGTVENIRPGRYLASDVELLPLAEDTGLPLREACEQFERQYVLRVLEGVQWNVSRAARLLGVHRNTVLAKLSGWGIQRPASPEGRSVSL